MNQVEAGNKQLIDIYRDSRRAYLRMKKRALNGQFPISRPIDRFHAPAFQSYGFAHWFDAVVPRLASTLMKAAGAKAYKIGGPYGLCSEFVIELYDDEAELSKPHHKRNGKRLSFRAHRFYDIPSRMQTSRIDFSTNLDEFPAGSIGDFNSMNYPSIIIDPQITMKEFLSLFRFYVTDSK